MMTTLTKYMKKTTAIAMAAMVLSLPLASVASTILRHRVIPTAMTGTTATTSMTVMTDTTVTTDMIAMTSVIRTTIT